MAASHEQTGGFPESSPPGSHPPAPTLSAGQRLGPYEVRGAHWQGGMGEVYRARDTRLGRQVAIKVLPHAFGRDRSRSSGSRRRRGPQARSITRTS